jgi:DNA-directed RNA polymerase subunit H (RpoH/RPB5)
MLTTCREMLADRGHGDVPAESSPLDCVLAERPVFLKRDEVALYISFADKVSVKFARAVVEHHPNTASIVLISNGGPTSFTRRECEAHDHVQFLLCSNVVQNVTKHTLVPRHERVPKPVSFEVSTLPKILRNDPIVQYYNWPPGTVIHIKRVFGGHEPIDYYRVVTGHLALENS